MQVEKLTLDSLTGRRLALTGFDPDESKSIMAALSEAGANVHIVTPGLDLPGLNPYGHYDVCVLNCTAPSDGSSPVTQMARAHRPVLLVGDLENIVANLAIVAGLKNDFVVRPLRLEEFLLKANRLARDSGAPLEGALGSDSLRVLIADDEERVGVMVSTILNHAGFECDIARDGFEAITMARQRRPDVVLLDVFMPKLDGFDALAAIRKDPELHDLPVIMVTSDLTESDVVRGFRLGADDYVVKPFNSQELVARIERTVRSAESRQAAG